MFWKLHQRCTNSALSLLCGPLTGPVRISLLGVERARLCLIGHGGVAGLDLVLSISKPAAPSSRRRPALPLVSDTVSL